MTQLNRETLLLKAEDCLNEYFKQFCTDTNRSCNDCSSNQDSKCLLKSAIENIQDFVFYR